jgi:hypothetical protein
MYFITWKNDNWIIYLDVLFSSTLKNHNMWNMVDEKWMKYVYFCKFSSINLKNDQSII